MKRTLLFAVVAFAFTAAVYWPCARFAYVPLDDLDYVVDNPNVRKGLTAETAWWAFTSQRYAPNCEWHPAAWLSMLFDVTVSGGNRLPDGEWKRFDNRVAKAMHLHNVLLHSASAALLFLLMAMLCRGRLDEIWLLGLALLWSVHPLRTEVVCWIAERKEALSVFWMLVSLLFYFNRSARFPRLGIAASFVAFLLALLAKPVAVTLPAVLLAWDWVFGRKPRIGRLLPFALASLGTCHMTIVSQQAALESGKALDFGARLTAIFGAPVIYVRQTFCPRALAAVYSRDLSTDWLSVVLGLMLVLAMAFVCGRWLVRRLREPSSRSPLLDIAVFCVAWAYVGLLPMLGIVKVGGEVHSDRYTYWSACGVAVCLALVLAEYGRTWRTATVAWVSKVDGRPFDWTTARRVLAGGLAATLVVLCALTRSQAEKWRSSLVFLRTTISSCWHYSYAEKMHALVRDTKATTWDEVEHWYRECSDRMPCIEAHVSLARFLLTRPAPEVTLGDRTNLYTEPKMLADFVLKEDPGNKDAKEILEQIEAVRQVQRHDGGK